VAQHDTRTERSAGDADSWVASPLGCGYGLVQRSDWTLELFARERKILAP